MCNSFEVRFTRLLWLWVFSPIDTTHREIILNPTIHPAGIVAGTQARIQKSRDTTLSRIHNPFFICYRNYNHGIDFCCAPLYLACTLHLLGGCLAIENGERNGEREREKKGGKRILGILGIARKRPTNNCVPMQRPAVAYSIGNSYFREPPTILSISKSGKFRANK